MNIQHNCYAHFKEICEINSNIPHHLCYGNHCHYCFDRSELFQFLPINKQLDHTNEKFIIGGSCNPAKLYYDWSPFPGWRFIVLDSYDVSLIGASSAENKKYAEELLYINNPNDLTMSGTWFNNLSKDKYRWVPYNGGIGKNQLKWLQNVLKESKRHEEKVIIFSHQPIFAETKSQSLIWNSEEVLDILWESNNVHMWMAGHDHDGQYSIDGNGIHHIVPPAPIERGIDDSSYGHISVHENELLLHWNGYTPQNVVKAWPKRIPFLK